MKVIEEWSQSRQAKKEEVHEKQRTETNVTLENYYYK